MLYAFRQNVDSMPKTTQAPSTTYLAISNVSADGPRMDKLCVRTMLADLWRHQQIALYRLKWLSVPFCSITHAIHDNLPAIAR